VTGGLGADGPPIDSGARGGSAGGAQRDGSPVTGGLGADGPPIDSGARGGSARRTGSTGLGGAGGGAQGDGVGLAGAGGGSTGAGAQRDGSCVCFPHDGQVIVAPGGASRRAPQWAQ
jgi:hypothetical protein